MRLIISHASPDFDALASMALAQLIHPGARAVRLGGLGVQLEAFLHLYRDELELLNADKLDLSKVEELIVVDTSDPARIAPFDTLLDKVSITLYDHHPRSEKVIPAIHGIQRDVGATVTILTLLLKARAIEIPQALASLALLGIHDDTGNLSYELTHPEDHEAAAHLLRSGASLNLVQRFVHEHYAEAHRELFAHMLEQAQVHKVLDRQVVMSEVDTETYVHGLAPLCNQLLTFFNADAAFIIACMDNKTLIIARSKGIFNVGLVLADALEGGGHSGAGFARTKLPVATVKTRLLTTLGKFGYTPILAKDIMSTPVNTVLETNSLVRAKSLLVRFGHTGLPVLNQAEQLVGIITKRNLDKALKQNLGHSPIKSIMIKKLITATEYTPLNDIEDLIEKHNIGRIPILKQENHIPQIVGIVSRSDIIRARHPAKATHELDSQGLARAFLARLPYAASDVLALAKREVGSGKLYLVGGTVRDVALGVSMQDLDLSVEGIKAETLGQNLQKLLGGELSCHLDFSTCTLTLSNGLIIDIALARAETYRYPGALPDIKPSSLQKDIGRRDFSINALAIRLNPEPADFIDLYGGLKDIASHTLRTLHPLSFLEDPTRIIRGAKLAARLNLSFDDATLKQLSATLEPKVLSSVSKTRLKTELELLFCEERVATVLVKLDEIGVLQFFFEMTADQSLLEGLDKLRYQKDLPKDSYLLALLFTVPEAKLSRLLKDFYWPKRYLESIKRLKIIRANNKLSHEQLKAATKTELALISVMSPDLEALVFEFQSSPKKRLLRGQDLLDLGLSPGPKVGQVLAQLAKARQQEKVTNYAEELELAKTLITKLSGDT